MYKLGESVKFWGEHWTLASIGYPYGPDRPYYTFTKFGQDQTTVRVPVDGMEDVLRQSEPQTAPPDV